MRLVLLAVLLGLVFVASSARSDNPFAPAAPVDEAAQIKLLSAKLEELDKRISELEEEKRRIQENLQRLTMFTELGIHFDVERAMMIPSPSAVMIEF